MKESLKYWWLFLLRGVILILLSVYIFQHPVGTLIGLVMYVGIATLFTGLLLVFAAFSGVRDEGWGARLTEGIIDVIFGIILLSNPDVTAAVLPFVLGFWIIFSGIVTFVGSFQAKKEGDSTWWMNIISGLLTIFIGYVIMSNFFSGAFAITFWIGLGFFIAGAMGISSSLKMRRLLKAL